MLQRFFCLRLYEDNACFSPFAQGKEAVDLHNIIHRIGDKLVPWIAVAALLLIWQLLCTINILPSYMLPSPVNVVKAFVNDIPLLAYHSAATLTEAALGLLIGIAGGFIIAFIMEHNHILYRALYPILVITQTVPSMAIAPLLVLWMGYGIAPKITLVVIMAFFPIAVGLLDGFREADSDAIMLMKAMGANKVQIFWHIKLPSSMSHFFAGIRLAVSYGIVGAVIAEWLGGFSGLGVYMTRVKKSYAYDRMFAVIFLITAISLFAMKLVSLLQRAVMPWTKTTANNSTYCK